MAAGYFFNQRLVAFDPKSQLANVQPDQLIKTVLAFEFPGRTNLVNSVVHFTSQDCRCSAFSEEHKRSIDENVTKAGFKIFHKTVTPAEGKLIPSTPAILITNDSGQLLYFGPYSAGLACSQSNGYVETVLANYEKGFSSSLVVNETKGCYCPLS